MKGSLNEREMLSPVFELSTSNALWPQHFMPSAQIPGWGAARFQPCAVIRVADPERQQIAAQAVGRSN